MTTPSYQPAPLTPEMARQLDLLWRLAGPEELLGDGEIAAALGIPVADLEAWLRANEPVELDGERIGLQDLQRRAAQDPQAALERELAACLRDVERCYGRRAMAAPAGRLTRPRGIDFAHLPVPDKLRAYRRVLARYAEDCQYRTIDVPPERRCQRCLYSYGGERVVLQERECYCQELSRWVSVTGGCLKFEPRLPPVPAPQPWWQRWFVRHK